MLVAFDLDGVLVDSLEIVRDAYRFAGVEAPPNILELEGVDWIADQLRPETQPFSKHIIIGDIRRAKAARYLTTIGKADLLPAYRVACRLKREGHTCVILSGAPVGTIQRVMRKHAWTWPFVSGLDGLRSSAKQAALHSMGRDLHPADEPVYIDDQKITVPRPWRLVLYSGQTEQELRKEIIG